MKRQRRLLLAALTVASGLVGIAHSLPAAAQATAAKPLKITVYGGSGAIGSRIVREALARGHQVTVVDRNPKPVDGADAARATVVKGDALDPADIEKNIAGRDVLVSSVIVRPPPTPDFSLKVVQAMVAAQRAQKGTPRTRFIDVGGASSLYNAEGKRIIEQFGSNAPAEVKSAVDALDWLKTVSDVPWTFFSPAMNIQPGERTGKFRIGTDQLVIDAQGRSAISMEDFAVAMLDEIENPKFVNRRFTVGY